MTHPVSAPARHPEPSPAGDDAGSPSAKALAALYEQANDDIIAQEEAIRAAQCIRHLTLRARTAPGNVGPINAADTNSLMAVLRPEFDRRMQSVKSTVGLMLMHSQT